MNRRTLAAVLPALFFGATGLTLGILALALNEEGNDLRVGRGLWAPTLGRVVDHGPSSGGAIAAIVLAGLALVAGLTAFLPLRREAAPGPTAAAPDGFREWRRNMHAPEPSAAAAEPPVVHTTLIVDTGAPEEPGPPGARTSMGTRANPRTELSADVEEEATLERPANDAQPAGEHKPSR